VLSRSDTRHVVVLGQRGEVFIQLFDALLVCFRAAFAFEAIVELEIERVSIRMRVGVFLWLGEAGLVSFWELD
jgi:hypothetical protein